MRRAEKLSVDNRVRGCRFWAASCVGSSTPGREEERGGQAQGRAAGPRGVRRVLPQSGNNNDRIGLRDIWGWRGAAQAEAQNSGSQGRCFPRSLPPAQGSRCAVPRSCLETVQLSSARPSGARARAAQQGSEQRGRQATVLRDVDPLVGWQSGEKHRKTRVLS